MSEIIANIIATYFSYHVTAKAPRKLISLESPLKEDEERARQNRDRFISRN